MKRPRFVQWTVAAALLCALVTGGASVAAQEATPVGTPAPPPGCEVIADGLLNPRYLDVAADGTIYVTEAGIGGDEVVTSVEEAEEGATPEEEASPEVVPSPDIEPPAPPATRGNTGQVTAIAPDGTQTVVATDLPSYSDGVGPAGIVSADGQLWVAVGGSYGIIGLEPLENEGFVVSIDPATGEVTPVADVGAYEISNNPDGTDINPNLYGMDIGADGQLYVADAGGNTVFRVDPATGQFDLLGVIPQRAQPGAAPEPAPSPEAQAGATPVGQANPFQSVPTAIHTGADGNIYVGLLGALVPGVGGVTVAQADGSFRDVVEARTAVVGVALGPDGLLYVSELSLNIEGDPPVPGDVVRIEENGTVTPILGGLVAPHGIAFDDAGNLLVVTNSVAFGPEPDGQVLRCSPTISTGTAARAASAASVTAAKLTEA